jgi:uncharacterized protein
MRFSEADPSGGYLIRAYGPDLVQVGELRLERSLVLTPHRLLADWRPQTIAELQAADFDPVLALEPEIILLGTGSSLVFPDPALYAQVLSRRVGLEIMDTGAACRTYNILMSEGRRVAAALLLH